MLLAWKLRGAVSPAGEIVMPVCPPVPATLASELQRTGVTGVVAVGLAVAQYCAPLGPPSPYP
jgi:hypothetical protein